MKHLQSAFLVLFMRPILPLVHQSAYVNSRFLSAMPHFALQAAFFIAMVYPPVHNLTYALILADTMIRVNIVH